MKGKRMSIRKRIDEAQLLAANGYDEAALIIALVALAGSSRLAYPKSVIKNDGEAFITYLDRRILETLAHGPAAAGSVFLSVAYKSKDLSIGRILYKQYRCNLMHEAELPADVSLDSSENSLFLTVSDDSLVLGRGWLLLLMDIVINDPALCPAFDDIRRKADHDLVYVGQQTEGEFEAGFIKRYKSSPGRFRILKRFLATVGPQRLLEMSDSELRAMWNDEVVSDPDKFGLDRGCLTGLSGPALQDGPQDGMEIVFLCLDFGGVGSQTLTLTDLGLEMLRVLLDHYR
jgi:hypothetical protein